MRLINNALHAASQAAARAKSKTELDARLEAAGYCLAHWTPHDIRRSVATGLANLGAPPHIIEAVLNHKSGTIRGVAATYNRHGYDAEKRQALNLWAEHVTELIEGRESKVVPLRELSR